MEELTPQAIKRYAKKTIPQLIKIATVHFNLFIRTRDQGKPCISCGKYKKLEAGHFYPAHNHSEVRFDEHNVNGECKQCNNYSGEHLIGYEKRLISRIGQEAVDKIHFKVQVAKRTSYKWDRFSLIEIIETYKQKNSSGRA